MNTYDSRPSLVKFCNVILLCTINTIFKRRVIEYLSTTSKVPSSTPAWSHTRFIYIIIIMMWHVSCILPLEWFKTSPKCL